MSKRILENLIEYYGYSNDKIALEDYYKVIENVFNEGGIEAWERICKK